jgi:hypothetical protein
MLANSRSFFRKSSIPAAQRSNSSGSITPAASAVLPVSVK